MIHTFHAYKWYTHFISLIHWANHLLCVDFMQWNTNLSMCFESLSFLYSLSQFRMSDLRSAHYCILCMHSSSEIYLCINLNHCMCLRWDHPIFIVAYFNRDPPFQPVVSGIQIISRCAPEILSLETQTSLIHASALLQRHSYMLYKVHTVMNETQYTHFTSYKQFQCNACICVQKTIFPFFMFSGMQVNCFNRIMSYNPPLTGNAMTIDRRYMTRI